MGKEQFATRNFMILEAPTILLGLHRICTYGELFDYLFNRIKYFLNSFKN